MGNDYRFSTATDDIDRALVHRWLSEESYWAKGRARDVQDAAIDASRNDSVHDERSRRQVGYARVVTDGVTFAWLCDVFVSADAGGSEVGKLLVGECSPNSMVSASGAPCWPPPMPTGCTPSSASSPWLSRNAGWAAEPSGACPAEPPGEPATAHDQQDPRHGERPGIAQLDAAE